MLYVSFNDKQKVAEICTKFKAITGRKQINTVAATTTNYFNTITIPYAKMISLEKKVYFAYKGIYYHTLVSFMWTQQFNNN